MKRTRHADDPLERLLSQALRAGRTTDVCPDAEQLASFAEHALDADGTRDVERHVAECGRCAGVVAALLDIEPASAGDSSVWWRVLPVRWAVPFATALVVAGIWFATHDRGQKTPHTTMVMASREVSSGLEGATQPAVPAAPKPDAAISAAPVDRTASSKKRPAITPQSPSVTKDAQPSLPEITPEVTVPTARAFAGQGFGTGQAVGSVPGRGTGLGPPPPEVAKSAEPSLAAGDSLKQEAVNGAQTSAANAQDVTFTLSGNLGESRTRRSESAATAASTDVPSAPPAQARAEAVAPPAPAPDGARGGAGGGGGGGRGGGRGLADGAGVAGGAARGGAAAGRAGGGRVQVDGLGVQAFAPLVLRNTSGTIEWRVRGASVERSTDEGATWAPFYTAPRALVAGAVATDDTVWLVGQLGLVVRGTAGAWMVVSAPVAIDLSNVSQVTTRGATVRTIDGRAFRTDDGGATWTPQ